MRYPMIDGMRGIFLVFMCVVHVNQILDVTIGKLNHHYFGWVEDAQGFIFISGFVVGMVYGRIYLKRGYAAMRTAILKRVKTIYSHQFGLIIIFLCTGLLLASMGLFPSILALYVRNTIPIVLVSVALVGGTAHMGILPMYIYFMLFTPLLIRAFDRGYAIPVAIGLALMWYVLGQIGLVDGLVLWIERAFAEAGVKVPLGIFFNVFAWQIIFYIGLALGFAFERGDLNVDALKHRAHTYGAYLAFVTFIVLGVHDRIVLGDSILPEYSQAFLEDADRGNFSLIYLVAFLVDLYLILWILNAGHVSENRMIRRFCEMWRAILVWRPLVFLGQHSLHVFSFHLLIVYFVACVYDQSKPSELVGSIVLTVSWASLYIAAYAHAAMLRRLKVRQAAPSSEKMPGA